jgi:hypothetical protein
MQQDPSQGMQGSVFDGLGQQSGGNPAGPDSSMFSDDQLAQMVGEDPSQLQGQDLYSQLMDPNAPPDDETTMRMMMAARRAGGF